MNNPRVGTAVLIFKGGKILLGKRKGSHGADTWAPPGGHLEFGESFEACAIREVTEETGVTLFAPEFLAVTNDIFAEEKKHYVTIFMIAQCPEEQTVKNIEPEKTESWEWFDTNKLPEKLFLPMQNLLEGEGVEILADVTAASRELH